MGKHIHTHVQEWLELECVTHTHTHTHTYTHMHARTHTHTHAHTHTPTHTHDHPPQNTHTCTHITYIHTQTWRQREHTPQDFLSLRPKHSLGIPWAGGEETAVALAQEREHAEQIHVVLWVCACACVSRSLGDDLSDLLKPNIALSVSSSLSVGAWVCLECMCVWCMYAFGPVEKKRR